MSKLYHAMAVSVTPNQVNSLSSVSGILPFYLIRKLRTVTGSTVDDNQLFLMLTELGSPDIAAGNNVPTITSSSTPNVAENTTAVLTVAATDPDSDPLTYSITGGLDQAKFSINGTTGVLTFDVAPDFETPTDVGTNNVYLVRVTADDGNGGTHEQSITVTVTDANDNTPVVDPAQSFNIAENASNAASLGTVTATDADAGTTFSSWTITGGNTDSIFTINSSTGQLTVSDNTNLDFETTSSYALSITVSDGTNTSAMEIVNINVTDEPAQLPVPLALDRMVTASHWSTQKRPQRF